MTNCDFSERPARDEMRHIIGSSDAGLMTKPIPKARIEQLMSLMGCEFVGAEMSALKGQATATREH